MTPEIRTATHGDAAELIAFWQIAGENHARPADTPEAIGRLLDRDPRALLVATYDERVVGTVIAGWDGWRAHLYRLAVAPDVRRHGVARLLLEHAEARLVGLGAPRFDAMVLEGNDLGRSAWVAAGYVVQASWRRWVKQPQPTSRRPHDNRN